MTTPNAADWNHTVPLGLGEREQNPRSMRWPKSLVEEVQKVADETNQDFSTAALYMLRDALDERRRAKKKKAS